MTTTPADRISKDLQALTNIIERRLDRVSQRKGECAFVLLLSVPNTEDDLNPESPGRVIYTSNTDRQGGAILMASTLDAWSKRDKDHAYFVEKAVQEIKKNNEAKS